MPFWRRLKSRGLLMPPKLPDEILAAIQRTTGSVGQVLTAGPPSPGIDAVVLADKGTFLLKAVLCDGTGGPCGNHGACLLHQRERSAVTLLPAAVPAPRLRFDGGAGRYRIAVYDYVGGEGANLSPGSGDLPEILGLVEVIGRQAAPRGLPPAVRHLETMRDRAWLMVPRMTEPGQAVYRRALAGFRPGDFAGGMLVHLGLGPDSLVMTRSAGLAVTGWAQGCSGPPWLSMLLLVPRLILAGHSAEAAQGMLSPVPAWGAAPCDAVNALAAVWALQQSWLQCRSSGAQQQEAGRAALAGREWLRYRYGCGAL